ncbi:hypothetical protein [Candidatus Deianiraea vastatrix]|uniref:Uncharacterized protein n=1 Tax=Candidatus Deianiraea vastatrix TaxID=2163644 RepID=A0A5B8XDE0_9RICK|nr:hypothetical protein [Candidatus Deianiraea vastatrix]QED23260.1 hypothetical protein Deia_00460 [Candidatus Deianiraea vastatrix]
MKNKHTLRQSGSSNYATNQRNTSKIGEGNEAFLKKIDKQKKDEISKRLNLLKDIPCDKEQAETILAVANLFNIASTSSNMPNLQIKSLKDAVIFMMVIFATVGCGVKAEGVRDDHRFQHAVDMIAQQDPQLAEQFSHCVTSIDDKSNGCTFDFGIENIMKACSGEYVIEITQDECWDGVRFGIRRNVVRNIVCSVDNKTLHIYPDNIKELNYYDRLYAVLIHELKHFQQSWKEYGCEENILHGERSQFSDEKIINDCFNTLDHRLQSRLIDNLEKKYPEHQHPIEKEAFLAGSLFENGWSEGKKIPPQCREIIEINPIIAEAVQSAISLTNDDDRGKHEVLKKQGFTKKELEEREKNIIYADL